MHHEWRSNMLAGVQKHLKENRMKHKNRTGSLRTKLLLSIVIMIAAILAVAGIVIVTSVSGSVTEINNLLTA